MKREINKFLYKDNFEILTQILKNSRVLTNFLNLCESIKSDLYIGSEGVLFITKVNLDHLNVAVISCSISRVRGPIQIRE